MSNLQPNCCLEFDFRKVDQHAGGKWLIHDTKRRKDNQLQSLKVPCRISKLSSKMWHKGVRWHRVESNILKEGPGTKTSWEVRYCRTPNHSMPSHIPCSTTAYCTEQRNTWWYHDTKRITDTYPSQKVNTVECRYNVVQCIMVLFATIQWQEQNINQLCNRKRQPITRPLGVSIARILKKIDPVITAPHCNTEHDYFVVSLS